jgi:flagellar protein FliO/FliZ
VETNFSFLAAFLQMLLALAIVVLLILISAKVSKKYINPLANKNLKILERASLSNKNSICIVKVGEELFLMGVSESNISILQKLPQNLESKYINKEINMDNLNFHKFISNSANFFRKDKR